MYDQTYFESNVYDPDLQPGDPGYVKPQQQTFEPDIYYAKVYNATLTRFVMTYRNKIVINLIGDTNLDFTENRYFIFRNKKYMLSSIKKQKG